MTLELRACLIWSYWEILSSTTLNTRAAAQTLCRKFATYYHQDGAHRYSPSMGLRLLTFPTRFSACPKECSHLVLSVGGNNASRLGISFFGMTGEPASKSLDTLADISEAFESQYRSAVDRCLRPGLPLGFCTIYNGCFPDKSY